MFDIVNSLLAFIVAISILVAIHEFGHFWVAKLCGVKVLRYSIGFGKPLWKKSFGPDSTEYVVGALPFGGYVKMLDEREGNVSPDELDRAFNRQSVSKRFAIVFAGPLFNFIFAFVAYWLMLGVGVTGLKPVIGNIEQDSILAQAGIQKDDEIVSINNQATPIWDIAIKEIITSAINKEQIEIVTRYKDGVDKKSVIDFKTITAADEPDELVKAIGLKPWRPAVSAQVGQVVEGSPADQGGLKTGDMITRIDSTDIRDWYDLVDYVSARPNTRLNIQIEREGQLIELAVTPEETARNGKKIGRMGIGPKSFAKIPEEMKTSYRYSLIEGMPEAVAMVWKNSVLTLKMIGKLIMGEISLKNLSGPINIAVYAGYSASAGFSRFLDFLAIVSISLGVINLLPIPILDGGHLFFYIVEIIRRKPLSEVHEALAQRLGVAILMLMMSVAIINDIARLVGY